LAYDDYADRLCIAVNNAVMQCTAGMLFGATESYVFEFVYSFPLWYG